MTRTMELRAAGAVAIALALAAAGCGSSGRCESSAICGEGEVCFAGSCVAALPAGSCTPPTAGSLTVGAAITTPATKPACDVNTPSTWPRPVHALSVPGAWALPLRVDGVDATAPVVAGIGQTVSFTVPPGTSSVTVHEQGVEAAASFSYFGFPIPNSVVPTAVRAPNGATVFVDDVNTPMISDPHLATGHYGGLTPWAGSFGIPGTSRLADLALSGGEVPPGTWSFQVNDWNAECALVPGCVRTPVIGDSYDVTVLARPGPYVSTGTLDVGIYVAGGTTIASSAVVDPRFVRFVWGLGQYLGRAGICLGTVTFFDTPIWAFNPPDISNEPPCSDLGALFSLASPSVNGVHLFLVNDLCVGNNCSSGIVGIDGSIPGPSGIPGAVTSGAAMIIDNIESDTCTGTGPLNLSACGSDLSAYIAAHEIGHWLGLYHPTERYGTQFDPIADTPTCVCDDCAPGPERSLCDSQFYTPTDMHPAYCMAQGPTCGGGDNLMFWQVDRNVSVGRLTAQQAFVMRVNPAVQ